MHKVPIQMVGSPALRLFGSSCVRIMISMRSYFVELWTLLVTLRLIVDASHMPCDDSILYKWTSERGSLPKVGSIVLADPLIYDGITERKSLTPADVEEMF